METSSPTFRFGPFEAKTCAQELSKNGMKIKLRGQPFQILEILLSRAGEVVSREEIREKLWPADTFVDFEHGLNTSIKKLRQTLGDSATEPRYIETLPRLGYRFIEPVTTTSEPSPGKTSPPAAKFNEAIPAPVAPAELRSEPSSRGSLIWSLVVVAALVVVFSVAMVFNILGARNWFSARFRSTRRAAVAVASARPLRSIAVLPLQNLSNNSTEDYFADGMTDELTTDLAQFAGLRVISRTSAIHYKGASKTAPEIGRELGVDTLIEGTVQRIGNQVRIRVQLIDTASDRHLWARTYDHEIKDVLMLQSTAARDIAEEVQGKVALPPAEVRTESQSRVLPEAYEAYLKGRYFWNKRTEDGLKKSIEYFQDAIAKDPQFGAAYAGLADSYSILGSDVLPARVASLKAHAAADKALELDPNIAEGHAELALVEFYYDWNWEQSEKEFRRAIELNPNYATAHQWYSYYLSAMGRFPEALEEATRAQQIDPLSLSINTTLVGRYRELQQYGRAIDLSKRTMEMDPGFPTAHVALGAVYEDQRIWPQAISEYQKAAELSQGSPPALAALAHVYGLSGNQKEAHKMIVGLQEASKHRFVSASDMAVAFAGVADLESAFKWLEKAYVGRESQMAFLNVTHRLDSLHSDPRFAELLHRMALPTHPASF
jgi:TolB-like protein/DNA-binding winged helix-turn-helix (wHTH) protein/Tfp pilus assembly protein PilF